MKIVIKFFIFSSLLCFPSSLFAFYQTTGSDQFELEAEWIYFRPSKNYYSFISTGSFVFDQESLTIDPSFHSGWRVGANYHFCNEVNSLAIRWTQLKTHDRESFFSATGFILPFGFSFDEQARIFNQYDFDYYAFEALLTHKLCWNCLNLYLFGGLQYAHIMAQEFSDVNVDLFLIPRVLMEEHSRFWGVGPEIGLNFLYRICNGFSFSGRAWGTLLVSRSKEALTQRINAETRITLNSAYWKMVPAWDLRFGLKYECALNCFRLSVEAGYECISYNDALLSVNVATQDSSFQQVNAEMNGPYVAFGVIF